jgi:FkbM family methyltransferase
VNPAVDSLFFTAARAYAWCYVGVRALTGRNIPGLGVLLRRCRRPRYIRFLRQWLYFEPAVASSYGLHIIDRVHEPEAHKLLNLVFDALGPVEALFIDVGANVGALVLDVARRSNVNVVGYEPAEACVAAIMKTVERNGRHNVSMFRNLVGERDELIAFTEGKDVQGASVYTSLSTSPSVRQIALDNAEVFRSVAHDTPAVLMIDVEGYEPKVLAGACKLIERLKPLIIFEYNTVSKRYFSMEEVRSILGLRYDIYRLRHDARLDRHVEEAWNCVAVPRATRFATLLASRVCAA